MNTLTAPAVLLAPDRHAFLVLGPGLISWSLDFGDACDDAQEAGGLVIAAPILADHSRAATAPVPPPRPSLPDTPSGSGSDIGGYAVGGRRAWAEAGWVYDRDPDPIEWPRDDPPASVVAAAYAVRGVLVPKAAIEAMRSTPHEIDLDVLTRVRDWLRAPDPVEPPSAEEEIDPEDPANLAEPPHQVGPVAADDSPTEEIDRRPFLGGAGGAK